MFLTGVTVKQNIKNWCIKAQAFYKEHVKMGRCDVIDDKNHFLINLFGCLMVWHQCHQT